MSKTQSTITEDTSRPCDGGCGKLFSDDHPRAKVICWDCAMEQLKEAREKLVKGKE